MDSTAFMSTERRNPNSPRPAQSPSHTKSLRVLACLNCQQRKVKCDRRFPCASCLKQKTQCIPATRTLPRKRRFAERELLDRLRKYEELLRQNNVKFDPLHKEKATGENEVEDVSDDEQPEEANHSSPATSAKSDNTHQAKYVVSPPCRYCSIMLSSISFCSLY